MIGLELRLRCHTSVCQLVIMEGVSPKQPDPPPPLLLFSSFLDSFLFKKFRYADSLIVVVVEENYSCINEKYHSTIGKIKVKHSSSHTCSKFEDFASLAKALIALLHCELLNGNLTSQNW